MAADAGDWVEANLEPITGQGTVLAPSVLRESSMRPAAVGCAAVAPAGDRASQTTAQA